MYSRFSKKEIVALGITGMSTLLMGSVLFMASATSDSIVDEFITGLETALPPLVISTGSTTSTGATNTSTNTGNTTNTNSTTNTSTSGNTTSGSNTSSNSTTNTSGNSTTTTGGNTSTSTNTSSNNNTSTNTNPQTTNTIQSAPTGIMQPIPTSTTTTPITTTTIPVFSNSTPTNSNGTAGGVTSSDGVTSGGTSPSSNANTTGNSTSLGGGLNSASQCKLPAIKILQVEELDTKTIVRWREIIGAAGYDVLKKSQSGEFVFIERVTKPIYTAHLARGAVKYEDFKIAAVCGDTKSASMNTSEVTSVKTGPMQLLLIVLSLNIGAALMLRRNFKKAKSST